MRGWINRADWLIVTQVLGALLLTWGVLLGFDAMAALVGELDEIGEGDYALDTAFLYVALTLPRRAYELFPTAALIGCVLGLGSLAATSELTALRAAGLPRWRIAAAAGALVLMLTGLMVISGETLGPWGDRAAQALAVQAKSKDVSLASGSGLWAREGDLFLNARRGSVQGEGSLSKVVLEEVRLFEFDAEGRLTAIALAARAEHLGNSWDLIEVRRTRFFERHAEVEEKARERWDSALSPEILDFSITRPRYLALSDLGHSIDYLTRNELDAGPFITAWWARVFYPLNALVLCLAVMPFAFGSLRSGGFGKRLFLGIAFGLGYFLLQRLSVNLAEVYHQPIWLANLVPPLVLGGFSWWRFRRRF
ncbi:MAG: LPS export ABC transporter permease LptG [Lysobacterales bacterium]